MNRPRRARRRRPPLDAGERPLLEELAGGAVSSSVGLTELARRSEAPPAWLDLLHETPQAPAAVDALRRALRFAFESGDAGGLLALVVDQASLPPSPWEPQGFAGSLFLDDLVRACFGIEVRGARLDPSRAFLVRVLENPSADPRDAALRQGVLAELVAEPARRAALEEVYVTLRRLRALLDEQPMGPGETVRRKVEVLTTVKALFDRAEEGLAGAQSALSRLGEHAARVRAGEAYARLSQVLDFDAHLATVDVRIVLGSDGRIRDFALVETRDNADNPLVGSAWSRLVSRLVAWLRGYRYGESEVLLRVLDDAFERLEDALLPCFHLVGHLEVYLAALGFRDRCAREGLAVCLPELADTPELEDEAGPLALEGLFNPLLLLQNVTPVPCDFAPGGHDAIVLVTGPNSGGKTRLLQSVALTHLLAHAGLFVPAARARLTRAPAMFVSLVEGGAADDKEGRLGTELMRIRSLFERLRPGALVILDELCSGTNPSEGIAIFEMVLSLLPRLRPQVLLTTHFLDAARALERERPAERLEFLQVELADGERPTYQFVPGVAPTSLAHSLAQRLGVTREELEALVRAHEGRPESESGPRLLPAPGGPVDRSAARDRGGSSGGA